MIIGLTDKPVLRRDGKIRAGYKEEGSRGKLVNTEHFLLHDAPQLMEVFGEKVTELYFTVHSDVVAEFAKADLRWYTASNINCMSMHNAPDADGHAMGSVAAYFALGEHAGVKQQQFPRMQKARVRNCLYKGCPQYVSGDCSEHLFLDIIIPQYSMGALFTLDSASINAVLNVMSTFNKAYTRYGGKISGQIFKLCKKMGEIKWTGSDGKSSKREVPIVHIDMVNFVDYESQFRANISSDDWTALMALRNRAFSPIPLLGAQETQQALQAPTASSVPQIGASQDSEAKSAEESIRARANDPAATKVFDEIAALVGKTNDEATRMATAKNFPDVATMIDYLKKRIAETKKTKAGQEHKAPPSTQAQTPPPPPPVTNDNPLY